MTDASKPPLGRKMKARAPPPPQNAQPLPQPAPRRIFRTAEFQDRSMDKDINMLRPTVELRITLPQGFQTTVSEDGSKALMDLLVELCSRYHLNPAVHTLELFSPEGHPLGFKPNALLGSLNVACILIKEKVLEERLVRRPAPKVPEKTVRLLVNYHGSQKAVVRVNPLLPLLDLVPVICDKCEFDPALVVLLKDSISRHELPLDKSPTQLGIKELYVHDKSLVLQPKMASAPALNYTDSICSSTTSLARAEKRSLLGIFQFSRRKSKTETTSLDMDDYDDNFQNREAHSNAMSTMFGAHYVDDRPNTMSLSQSAINISKTSPKTEIKKRRAPAPPGIPAPSTLEYLTFDNNQSLGSQSQQRKRKAPAPPPTPVSINSGSDDTSAAVTPVSQHVEAPIPSSRSKVAQSAAVSASMFMVENVKPVQPAVCSIGLTRRSSTPGSTTSESLVVQDTSSELSQSLEDSDVDPGSHISSTSGSTVSGPAQSHTIETVSTSRVEKSEITTNMSASDVSSNSSSQSDTEVAMNFKIEETENNRHSGVAWLHSIHSPAAKGQIVEMARDETGSLGSNSSGSSLPDQEGMVDGEDSGLVSSPSETHTTSPDGSLSLDGSTGGERLVGMVSEHYSDSDEGCATWGSQHRYSDVTPQPKTARVKHQDLSAQLHQTLADLESDLAESNEVPVSIVDHDVPVTTIDEVLPDDGFWTRLVTNNGVSCGAELQNKNNNAHTATDTKKSTDSKQSFQNTHKEKSEKDKTTKHKKEESTLDSKTKEIKKIEVAVQNKTPSEGKSSFEQENHNKSDITHEAKKIHKEEKTTLPPVNVRPVELERVHQNITSKTLQSKITPNMTSRFGMKTFTVVPPKPSVIHAAAGEPTTTTPGAIKIDEQGNMVTVTVSHHRADPRNGHDSPLLGKAKAFWSSNEKQDGAVAQSKCLSDKAKEESHKSPWTKTSETTQKATDTGSLKASQGTLNKSSLHMEHKKNAEDCGQQMNHNGVKEKDLTKVADNISTTVSTHQLSQKPSVPPPMVTDMRRDLYFLKPSRRTSSQYVASAITKYTPKTTIQADNNSTNSDILLKPQNPGFQKSGRSIQINPQHSFRSNDANNSGFTYNLPGPKRSVSYPEHISNKHEDNTDVVKETEKTLGSTKGSFRIKESKKFVNEPFAAPTQLEVKVSDSLKPIQHRSSSPTPSIPPFSSAKTLATLNGHQEQNKPVMTKTANSSKSVEKLSVAVTESEVSPEPPAVTVFGPVKKFRPVICKSVEKETSLHSSLMEAIQTGGGKERLKKISTSGVSSMKKSSNVEDENERSALLAAIRAQGNSGRLRKTKSEAAEELEQFRKAGSDDTGSAHISTSSIQASVPPPKAPAPSVAPPPPPLVLPLPKSSVTLSQPNINMNPAMAREAMLEAIRSGSAAEKLKKVAVPAKTVQVNGRLGTIRATSTTS